MVINKVMWVKQCHLHHPPVIIIFIGGIQTILKWVVYGFVLPTFVESPKFIVETTKKYGLYMAIASRNLKNM
jgi:hypothetical protein